MASRGCDCFLGDILVHAGTAVCSASSQPSGERESWAAFVHVLAFPFPGTCLSCSCGHSGCVLWCFGPVTWLVADLLGCLVQCFRLPWWGENQTNTRILTLQTSISPPKSTCLCSLSRAFQWWFFGSFVCFVCCLEFSYLQECLSVRNLLCHTRNRTSFERKF